MRAHFVCQEFKNRNETPAENLIKNKPDAAFTEPNLLLKKAQVCHTKQAKGEMLSTLQKLPKDEQISFLERNGYVEEAADKMAQSGEKSVNSTQYLFPDHTHSEIRILSLYRFLSVTRSVC